MSATRHAFVCDAIRTPFGRYGGALSSIRTDDLGAIFGDQGAISADAEAAVPRVARASGRLHHEEAVALDGAIEIAPRSVDGTVPDVQLAAARCDVDRGLEHRGKLRAIACEKPLARNVAEARRCVELIRRAGVLHGYLEDQLFIPALVKGRALAWARGASISGRPYLARSAEEHSGPHMPWFWQGDLQGGGVGVGHARMHGLDPFRRPDIRARTSCWIKRH